MPHTAKQIHCFITIPKRLERVKREFCVWFQYQEGATFLASCTTYLMWTERSDVPWEQLGSSWHPPQPFTDRKPWQQLKPILTCMIRIRQISSLIWWISLGFGRRISCLTWHNTLPLPHSGWKCSVGSKAKVSFTNCVVLDKHMGYDWTCPPDSVLKPNLQCSGSAAFGR